MSDATTIARPYAKALFNLAFDAQNETKSNQLAAWSNTLDMLAQAVSDVNAQLFLQNPMASVEQQAQVVLCVCSKNKPMVDETLVDNFVHLLAVNKRLLVLPNIWAEYELLRAEQEKTLSATVVSFAALSSAQEQKLIESLSKRLNRNVTLNITIDSSILGGAIIGAGDLVIDGSVRGSLNKLKSTLAA